MPNIIKPKRSNTAAKVPTTTELISGELGVNMADRKVYINNGTAVVQVGAGNLSGLGDVAVTSPINGQSLKYNSTTTKWENSTAGAGDVVGPASATDNALVRFDGTSGKLIQNSLGVLDDSGNLDVTSAKADYFDLDTAAAAPASAVGREAWDDGSGAPIVGLKGGVVTYYYGQQEFARVYNGSGAALTKGQVVYIVGAQGNRIDVRLALATSDATSANTIGLVAEPIAIGAEGWVQTTGPMPKMVTTGLTAGAAIYLSPTTAGAYTTTKPSAPNHLVILGFVERVDATVGSIYLKVDNGYELDELHNVNTTSPTGGQLLAYDQTAGYWKNITLTDGTGVSITETTAGAVTINLATAYGDTLNPYASKTANNFLAAPNGTAGAPTFRAIAAADIPTLNQNTTGNAATATTLQSARTINGTSFNGSANITVEPYVEQDLTTNAELPVTFVDSTTAGFQRLNLDTEVTINPSLGRVKASRVLATTVITAPTIYLDNGDADGGEVIWRSAGYDQWFADNVFGTWRLGYGTTTNAEYNSSGLWLRYQLRTNGNISVGGTTAGGSFANGSAIALGDNDTGIRQNGDGVLEVWNNNTSTTTFGSNGQVWHYSPTSGQWSNQTLGLWSTASSPAQPGIGFHAAANFTAGILKFYGPSNQFEFRNSVDNAFGTCVGVFNNVSDYRQKNNITDLPSMLAVVESLRPVSFDWKEDNRHDLGFIAHEVQEIIPEAVNGKKDATHEISGQEELQSINVPTLVAACVKAVQELSAEIKTLKAEIAVLKGQ